MILILLVGTITLHLWAWRRLQSRIKSGAMSKVAALLQYGAWALAPPILFVALSLSAVGVEELTGAAIISEPLGRAALLISAVLLGIAGVGWVSFAIVCGVVWRPPGAKA